MFFAFCDLREAQLQKGRKEEEKKENYNNNNKKYEKQKYGASLS